MNGFELQKTNSGTGYYVPLSSEPERARLTAGEESCESALGEGLLVNYQTSSIFLHKLLK